MKKESSQQPKEGFLYEPEEINRLTTKITKKIKSTLSDEETGKLTKKALQKGRKGFGKGTSIPLLKIVALSSLFSKGGIAQDLSKAMAKKYAILAGFSILDPLQRERHHNNIKKQSPLAQH